MRKAPTGAVTKHRLMHMPSPIESPLDRLVDYEPHSLYFAFENCRPANEILAICKRSNVRKVVPSEPTHPTLHKVVVSPEGVPAVHIKESGQVDYTARSC